jgi:large subunit ribosomal protein L18
MRRKFRRALTSRQRRHVRVRAKVKGTRGRPRLNVFRSSAHIYAQVIDDDRGQTLVAASDLERKAAGIDAIVFDRGGFIYHGRVKAVAEGARGAGLAF